MKLSYHFGQRVARKNPLEIPLGEGYFLFQRKAKFPLAGRLFSWRAQGGFRIPSSPVKWLRHSPGTRAGILRNRQPLVALCAPSSLRVLQTTRNPPETATVGARRPRRGATPDHPARAANIIPPVGLTVLAFIRPDFSGGASRGGGREAPLSVPLEGVGEVRESRKARLGLRTARRAPQARTRDRRLSVAGG